MSGQFNPDEPGITATDNPDIARRLGLTQFNRETGQFEAPSAPDAGQRDGTTVPGHAEFVGEQGSEVVEPPPGEEIKPADDGGVEQPPAEQPDAAPVDGPPAEDVGEPVEDTPTAPTRKTRTSK